MNWSRGLLRAWMVFTVLWSIGVGTATYHQWPQKEQFAEHPNVAIYTGAFTYIGPQHGAPNLHIVQAPDGSRHILKAPEGTTRDEVIAHAPQPVSNELEYRQSVRENLVMAVAMTAGLPAVLFVIGWAVLWIGRGFRKS